MLLPSVALNIGVTYKPKHLYAFAFFFLFLFFIIICDFGPVKLFICMLLIINVFLNLNVVNIVSAGADSRQQVALQAISVHLHTDNIRPGCRSLVIGAVSFVLNSGDSCLSAD